MALYETVHKITARCLKRLLWFFVKGSDEDDVVIGAFKSFDDGEGNIDGETLRHALMTWGDRFSSKEVDDAYESMTIDGAGKIDCQKLIEMLTAAPVEEDAEAA